jgi:hypothetical protein
LRSHFSNCARRQTDSAWSAFRLFSLQSFAYGDEHSEWKNSQLESRKANIRIDNDSVDASGNLQPDRWHQAPIFRQPGITPRMRQIPAGFDGSKVADVSIAYCPDERGTMRLTLGNSISLWNSPNTPARRAGNESFIAS